MSYFEGMGLTKLLGYAATAGLFLLSAPGAGQTPSTETNYDEAKVPAYVLPDPLLMSNGERVSDADTWRRKRRPEIVSLFESHVYGRSPDPPLSLDFTVTSEDRRALSGKATRKQVSVFLSGDRDGSRMDILIYLPNHAVRPVPAFLGLNFRGNQAIHSDPGITLSTRWMREDREGTVANNRALESSRGSASSRWPVERILERGFALATVYYGDLEPDHADGWRDGIRSAIRIDRGRTIAHAEPIGSKRGAPPDSTAEDWGAIAAWAWGLSRALDYLEKDPEIDGRRVAVIGHSRLGKTALWAGARDERFAIVISNNSGCGGAALSRRRFGETVERINTSFPHWFCANFKRYNGREDALPVDQHMLVALIAPRPVYIASAEKDLWADPRGEFLSAKNAEPVYRLLGKHGLGTGEMPGLNAPVGETIRYHIRAGGHDVTDYDWEQYLSFADRNFPRN